MKILVLGHTGFVGKNLFQRLKKDNHNVYGLSRSTGLDILNYNDIRNKIAKIQPEIIYNVASHGGSIHYVNGFAADVFSDNLQMALNIYKAVGEINNKIKIIQPFSNCSYPGNSSIQSEDMWLKGPVHPSIFSFGNSKRSIYYLSECYYKQHEIKTTNLLFSNTYGPGDSEDPNKTHALNGMIIRMIHAKRAKDKQFVVWGTGSPIREWTYIDDFVEALVLSLGVDHMEYPMNVSQQQGHSIADSARIIKKLSGYDGEIVFDTSYTDGDPVKIMNKDAFSQAFPDFKFHDYEKGIAKTIEYYEGIL
jgi:GDP-L-fucose synthase